MNNQKRQTYFLWMIIFLILISLIPMISLSFYDHPSADDYSYARFTGEAWRSTRNLFSVLVAAVETAIHGWYSWQGPFTSAFFMALQPALFGEQYYRITGILFISMIVICNLIFFNYIFYKRLKCHRLSGLTLGMAASFFMLQYVPLASEVIYWFCGAVHYTLFFSLTELLICLLLDMYRSQSKLSIIIHVTIACVLGFLISGGNQMAAFGALLLTFGLCVACAVLKKKSYLIPTSIVLFFQICGFLLSALSPGTENRSSAIAADLGIVGSITASIQYGLACINEWFGFELLICLIVLLPFVYDMAKKVRSNTNFKFRYPLLVFILSVGFLCALFCPTFYALGSAGPKRLISGIYFMFILLVFLNFFYFCGWIQKKISIEKEEGISLQWLLVSLLLIFGGILGGYQNTVGHTAYLSVSSGEAGLYSQQADARYNELLQCKGQDVAVERYDVYPALLFVEEVTGDPDYFINQMVRSYFELESIVLK